MIWWSQPCANMFCRRVLILRIPQLKPAQTSEYRIVYADAAAPASTLRPLRLYCCYPASCSPLPHPHPSAARRLICLAMVSFSCEVSVPVLFAAKVLC